MKQTNTKGFMMKSKKNTLFLERCLPKGLGRVKNAECMVTGSQDQIATCIAQQDSLEISLKNALLVSFQNLNYIVHR